jgi:hypothetical protein
MTPIGLFGQTPDLQIYTQISFCYPLSKERQKEEIVQKLKSGFERLTAAFPWIAGKIVNEGASEGNTGIFKIVDFEKIPAFIVEDLTNDASTPSFAALEQAKFPAFMMDEGWIAPRRTLPGHPEEANLKVHPVFLSKATFVQGGLILTFMASHQFCDMTGLGSIIRLLSKACRNEAFTDQELSSKSISPEVIPYIENYQVGPELDGQLVKERSSQTTDNLDTPPAKALWAYVLFSSQSLADIKKLSSKDITSYAEFVSTDDSLCAFIWQSVTRARSSRLSELDTSTFARAVDVRRFFGLDDSYLGLLQNMTYNKVAVQTLSKSSLGSIASRLRSKIDSKDIVTRTRALASFVKQSPDKRNVSFTSEIDASKDVLLSSWAKVDCYDQDFGLGLGNPAAIRRPCFQPYESLMYLLPKRPNGEIALLLCLREDDMKNLRADQEFSKYGVYIG